ncbi:MAG TPA: PmoA family protein [Pyrinomonadaceae bacterium]|nr:PmoA family protein [Pyrinomonadaceae bacterium]
MKIPAAATVVCLLLIAASIRAQSVRLIPRELETRIDVEVGGKLFTSYRWDEKIRRPVLFPLMSVGGGYITRGFPVETRDGETIGHPHQVGVSFSYGNVNGIDFWNNSPFRTEKELEHMGRIVQKKILEMKSGIGSGELTTTSAWIHPNGTTLLLETTKYTFHAKGNQRWIDRETVLTANDQDVVFGDSKEGVFAIHLATELEQAGQLPVKVTSAGGVISDETNSTRFTGKYFNSEGVTGDKIWGTTGKWAAVTGKVGMEDVTVAVFDSPKNHNFPSYMMVRGYGLLAVNPFGQKQFEPNKEERRFTLAAKRSITFWHRLVILPQKASKEAVEKEFQAFIK